MDRKKATRHSCNYAAPKKRPYQDSAILHDYDRATLVGGLLIAFSFGSMLVLGGWMGW